MRWFIYIAVAVLVLIGVVFAIGSALPMAHIATRHARFQHPPVVVYALISGPQKWRPEVAKSEEVPHPFGPRRWKEYSKRGDAVTFEVTKADPPRTFQARIADKNLPFGGTWTWDITPAADGCDLRITEAGEVYNPVFRFIGRFFIGYTRSIDAYLNALGKKLGEPVNIEP